MTGFRVMHVRYAVISFFLNFRYLVDNELADTDGLRCDGALPNIWYWAPRSLNPAS